MDNLVIRELKVGDIEEVSKVYNSIVQLPKRSDLIDELKAQCKSTGFVNLIAELDGRIVGFLISYIFHGGFGIDKSAWISLLCAHPDFMGQGIGQKLAEHASNDYKAMGIRDVHTSFNWDSMDLISFFKTLGFDRSEFVNLSIKIP